MTHETILIIMLMWLALCAALISMTANRDQNKID
jgi:hypothetical protein